MQRGTIEKREGKRGTVWTIRFRDASGKHVRQSFKKKDAAERALTAITGAIAEDDYQPPQDKLFRDLAAEWLAYKEVKTRPRTFESYKAQLDLRILPVFGDYQVRKITWAMIRAFETDLLASDLAPGTISHTVVVLKSIFGLALEDGYITKNPALKLRKPKKATPKVDWLRPEQIQSLLAATDRKHYPLMVTACMTGARRGELLGLTWAAINWSDNTIHIHQSLQCGKFAPVKSEESNRVIPMHPEVRAALEEHRARLAVELPENKMSLCFPNEAGKPMDGGNLLVRIFQPTAVRAGLGHHRFHDLRHSFCVGLLSRGVPIKAVQKLMGHSSIKITADVYGDIVEGVQTDAISGLGESFLAPAKSPEREQVTV